MIPKIFDDDLFSKIIDEANFYKAYKQTQKGKSKFKPDAMKFASKVISIKSVRGKTFATLLGSAQNINPTLSRRNLPLSIYHDTTSKHVQDIYQDVDFVGYTCIESDYLYRGFSGKLAVGDYVVFSNVGSYSLVLKPPFILPNFAVVEYDTRYGSIELVKENETFEDVFHTFKF